MPCAWLYTAITVTSMTSVQARLDSYTTKRVPKNPLNSSTSNANTLKVKWPHAANFKATPTTLADAGFVYAPSIAFKDNVSCFFCSKELNSWTQDDDPAEVHYDKCGDTCAWASLKCGLVRDLNKDGEYVSFPSLSTKMKLTRS